jgi:L-rhamnose isomerase
MKESRAVESAYQHAKEQYAELGVDTDAALRKLDSIHVGLHSWQADDVGGFEAGNSELSGGGIQVTGNFPGKPKTISQLRQDMEKVLSVLPGKQRLALQASYGDFGGAKVDRNQIELKHFQSWIDWSKEVGMTGIDLNPTLFSHPESNDGFTLSSKNEKRRRFWIDHVKRARKIGAEMGKQMGTPCVDNIWLPDGSKDLPVDRSGLRAILKSSLDEIFSQKYPEQYLLDALEGKLFGLGSEAMVVGSHEFYLGYAAKNNICVTIDTGHYHPTEQPGDKISAMLPFVQGIQLHISRGIHWDSDHITIFDDNLQLLAQEVVRSRALDRVYVGIDYFDGSVNRLGAYVVGARATQLAFLFALLEPTKKLREYEEAGKYFERLALLECLKAKPFGAVYDYYCLQNDVPVGERYIQEIQKYEAEILSKRSAAAA